MDFPKIIDPPRELEICSAHNEIECSHPTCELIRFNVIEQFTQDVFEYSSQCRSWLAQNKTRQYHLTFSCRPDVDKDKFIQSCHKFAKRKVFKRVEYVFEHMSTNIHCHMNAYAKMHFRHSDCDLMKKKYGNVKIQHIVNDNGVSDYIHKQEPDKSEVFDVHPTSSLEKL